MKGTFRIGGAVFVGLLIILAAFLVRTTKTSGVEGTIVALPPAERMALTTRDSDNDGVEDWEESLEGRIFAEISLPTSTPITDEDLGPYEEPTTLTGKFSEAFLQDYLEGKMQGTDFSDPSLLVGSAVEAIESSSKARKYTRLDTFRIATSPESVQAYGNELAGIMQEHSVQNENEAVILQKALTANDPEILKELIPPREAYIKIIRDALSTPVPEALATEHLAFVNASEAIRTDISAMEQAFTDPLYALARIREYEKDALSLYESLVAIRKKLAEYEAEYENNEPGAFFYLFES